MPTIIPGMHERYTQYKEEYALIEKYIKNKENFIVFDVGAHDFSFGSSCSDIYENCTSYGFEADGDTYNIHAKKYANLPRKKYVNLAVSNNCEDTLFYPSSTYKPKNKEDIVKGHRDSGSICKPIITDETTQRTSWGVTFKQPYNVTTTTLSKFCEDNNIETIAYLHIDVQGAENKVIEGLGCIRPQLIFAEVNMFG